MSNTAKVWNDGDSDYREMFRDQEIVIPRGKFVEMDRYEAAAFVSQYIKPRRTEVGTYLNHKKLRVEVPSDAPDAKVEHRCMICKGLFASPNELALHSEAFHKAQMIEDEPKEEKKTTAKAK